MTRLYGLDWVALAPSDGSADGVATDNVTVLRCPTTTADGAALADGTRRALAHVLDRVQNWLSDDSRDEDARLVVLTRGAIAVDSSEDVTDLGQAAVWGLLRTAQTENPGQILLADVDDWASADVAVAETASRDESQLALRDGACFAPRLVRTAERLGGAELGRGGHLATYHPRQRHAGLAERCPALVARIQPTSGARRGAIGCALHRCELPRCPDRTG